MPKRVFDCFLYNGEPILDLRLEYLGPHVDRFVIVESSLTFKGDAKPPRFRREMAGAWAHKVDYVLLGAEDHDGCRSAWDREALQRNAIRRGLAGAADDDAVLISDVDEIPDPAAFADFDGRPAWLRQLFFAYYGNMLCTTEPHWLKGTRLVRAADARRHAAEDIRLRFGDCFPEGRMVAAGGWHFTYLGGVESITRKIGEFSHQELNTAELNAPASIAAQIRDRLDIFYRPVAFAVVRPGSLGNAAAVDWFRDRGMLFPGGDDGVDVADVVRRHDASGPLRRRLGRWRLKWIQKRRRQRRAAG